MWNGAKAVRWLGGVLLLGLAAVACTDGGEERAFRIGTVAIDASLEADGSLRVVEQREFVYDGEFTQAFYELPLRDGQQVREVTLTDSTEVAYQPSEDEAPGTYQLEQEDDRFEVSWTYAEPAVDERRTFTLSYAVTGAAVRHADSAELYWQWVGTGWDVPTERVVADVTLPEGAEDLVAGEDLRLWGHGPLNGSVEVVEPGVVRTAVEDLAPETFVELRVLVPPDLLAEAPSDDRAVRDAIVAEEDCLAIGADADRARAAGRQPGEDCDPRADARRVATVVVGAIALVGLLGWVGLWLRYGREHPLPAGLPDHELSPPSDDPPALIGYLRSWGKVTNETLVATILDLARCGVLNLRRDGEVVRIAVIGEADAELDRGVVDLVRRAAGGERDVTDAQLKAWVAGHRAEAHRWWKEWSGVVTAEGARRGWSESQTPLWVGMAVGAVVLFAGLIGLAFGAWPPVTVGAIVAGAALLACTPLLRRRSPEGRVLHHRWRRFGEGLQQRSAQSGQTAELWDRDLVYAVPLGLAKPVLANLDAHLPESQRSLLAWYPFLYVNRQGREGGSFSGGFEGLSGAVSSSAISASPSSTGAGGGFSGGGGGGGGGSGGGAS